MTRDDWDRLFDELYLRTYAPLEPRFDSKAEAFAAAKLAGLEPGADVLDCPCGYGRHSIPLARARFHVVGADRSSVLLEEARRRAGEGEWPLWVEADHRKLPFADASFDCVLNLFTALGYRGEDGDRKTLAEFRRVLRPEGVLVVGTMHRDRLARIFRSHSWDPLPDGGVLVEERSFDQIAGEIETMHMRIGPTGERESVTYRVRTYAVTELIRLLEEADFTAIECYGASTARSSRSTPGWPCSRAPASRVGAVELLAYRERFPILRETTYLINHSLGAMPAEAERRLAEYARTWATRGIRAWGEGWWTMPMTVGDQIGRIVGAPPGSVVMHQNVTVAEAIVLSCFDLRGGDRNRIVYEEPNFPSVRYLHQAQTARGAEVVVCPDDAAVVEAIDKRTLLVPISHVLFRNGEIQDVEAIVARAHEAGALVLLDAYQSAGIVPLDVTALDVDFAVGGSVKWLCGGPGAGWLYVRPDLAERLEPTYVGWQAHARPFAFEPELEYAEGAARFLTGTPNVPALYAATAGYDLVEEIGVERIRESSLRQTELLIRLADEAGFEVGSPRDPARRGGTVTVRVPEFEAVHKELGERGILCDFRPDAGLRLGPHYYNTDEELAFAVEQIAEILESGAYERHLGAVARF